MKRTNVFMVCRNAQCKHFLLVTGLHEDLKTAVINTKMNGGGQISLNKRRVFANEFEDQQQNEGMGGVCIFEFSHRRF